MKKIKFLAGYLFLLSLSFTTTSYSQAEEEVSAEVVIFNNVDSIVNATIESTVAKDSNALDEDGLFVDPVFAERLKEDLIGAIIEYAQNLPAKVESASDIEIYWKFIITILSMLFTQLVKNIKAVKNFFDAKPNRKKTWLLVIVGMATVVLYLGFRGEDFSIVNLVTGSGFVALAGILYDLFINKPKPAPEVAKTTNPA